MCLSFSRKLTLKKSNHILHSLSTALLRRTESIDEGNLLSVQCVMSHLLRKHFHSRVRHSTWHTVGAQCKCLWREGMISLLRRTRSYTWYVIRGTFSKTHWFSDKCKYYWPMGNAASRLQVQSMQQECVPSFYSVPIPMRAEQQKGSGRCGCWLQSYNLLAEAELINRQWEEKDSRGSDHNSGSNQQV